MQKQPTDNIASSAHHAIKHLFSPVISVNVDNCILTNAVKFFDKICNHGKIRYDVYPGIANFESWSW
jgi:hypothetical protein